MRRLKVETKDCGAQDYSREVKKAELTLYDRRSEQKRSEKTMGEDEQEGNKK